MTTSTEHTFHVPVMGLAFTIDTPVKIAHFGISSVISIVEDHLIEDMRKVISRKHGIEYHPIPVTGKDSRSNRITCYLNLLKKVVEENVARLKEQPFDGESDICTYFEMLPTGSSLRQKYQLLPQIDSAERLKAESELRNSVEPGEIDVNIMTKVDRPGYSATGEALPDEYSDALTALKGFAESDLSSSVVFSAGLNPRLYSYCERFSDFFPDRDGIIKKRIILKVSDYRSALIQGKFLAKKGLWVTEFRIESGLNCGGHAFATQGMLMGPILEEFKQKRAELYTELFSICSAALNEQNKTAPGSLTQKITAQGGIGRGDENEFLLEYYDLDATGWGSPFLLVPEVTNVDEDTLAALSAADPSDYYLSYASPLGVPFNNFRKSSSEKQRMMRISKNRPGSPCYKKFLSSNTEFTDKAICTASREYQNLKLKEIKKTITDPKAYELQANAVMEKDCLCEGLGASALLKNDQKPSHGLTAVTICPGPNLAFFSGIFSLREMTDHIYGRANILNTRTRPHMFVNELKLYVNYLISEIERSGNSFSDRQKSNFITFRTNLLEGIRYYQQLADRTKIFLRDSGSFLQQLTECQKSLSLLTI